MKRRIAEVLAGLACVCLLAGSADAQVTLAAIRGKVTDEQGAVLPGATVTARHVATNTVKTAFTTELGQYYLPNLPAGEYEVPRSARGCALLARTIQNCRCRPFAPKPGFRAPETLARLNVRASAVWVE